MRKWMVGSACVATVAAAAALISVSGLKARPAAKDNEEPAARVAQLPIGQVVLFSSGVGYFQREGSVEGDARVDLSFPVSDINDLIKSMVLRDLDGGHISSVSYDSNAPIERTLKSFAVNLTTNPNLADILNQARGEKAEVALTNAGAGAGAAAMTGTIIGVERQRQSVNKEIVETSVLNLWCADGMRGVKLSDVQRVRFLNPTLDSEFKKALETLALSHDTQKKAVSIRCVGEGKRRVRVGYVVENPIWKTSYRLVLGTKGEEKPFLQGWAVVENPTDEDWNTVRMSLVSGRPISFQMDLYQPLYIRRPVVVPELFQSLNPVAYSGSLDNAPVRQRAMTGATLGDQLAKDERGSKDRRGDGKAMFGLAPAAPAAHDYADTTTRIMQERLKLGEGVATAASAAKLGDYFQYAIDRPVTLPRQKSALLPIVGKDVQATRVSIYNEGVQAKFPLLGLRFKNSSGLHLMQGPITVFEGSNYAGDARILDLQPNEERLISYAIDLGCEVSPAPAESNGRITHLKAVKGVLYTTTKLRESRVYAAKNRNEQERTLLIEHPVRHDFKLVDAKPSETASDVYRFEVKLPSGASKSLTVTEERDLGTTVSISSQSDEQIRLLVQEPAVSEKLKAGLKQAQSLRWELEKTRREIAEQQKQLNIIVTDQGRLRANLKEMPSTAKAYKRYLEKFDEQETLIEKYQADIKKLQSQEHAHQKSFDDFLVAFSSE